MKNIDLINRFFTEYIEISEKWNKLCPFLGSSEFKDLTPKQQKLVLKQTNIMFAYMKIVSKRLHDLGNEEE